MVNKFLKVFTILEQDHQTTMLEMLKKEDFTNFQLLVATLLSSRTKDSTTIPIVKKLFKRYSTAEDFVKLDFEKLEKGLYGIGFYRVKAKNIKKLAKMIIEKYDHQIPNNLEELISLPGVGRKTANCILSYAFDQPAIAVDTHVHRIVNRLAWVNTENVIETEEELKKILIIGDWKKVNMLLVDHGQRVCFPINPNCKECKVKKYCKFGKERV